MKTKEAVSEYDQQAADFLKQTGAKITKVYTGHRPYWQDEKEFRATYMVTITRGGKPAMAFNFGQSIMNSWKLSASSSHGGSFMKPFEGQIDICRHFKHTIETGDDKGKGHGVFTYINGRNFRIQKQEKAPTDYDILAGLTKYDPSTFDDFCSDYGYDTNSRKAETTYQAVRKEYQDLSRIFNHEELEAMAEIQ